MNSKEAYQEPLQSSPEMLSVTVSAGSNRVYSGDGSRNKRISQNVRD
ncbi:hypothetical protein EVA_12373 [gut metagenome]|uniref:Uncharacterized protein n=1 Tax=gut metagenome TaxID=749906 RepID=J9GIY6_9ZZZZ